MLIGSASSTMVTPYAAAASFFSLGTLLSRTATVAEAYSNSYNSQTVPLLSPAVNLDPRPSVGGGDINVVEGQALLAQEGPEGTAADIAAQPSSSAISVYIVRPGDSISTIAQMFGVSVNTIKWANDLPSGTIHPGDTLIILPVSGVRHTVVKGDTVASLAKKYNADADEILTHNDISGDLVVGQQLLIPNGTIAAAPAPRRSTSSGSAGGPAITGYFGWPVAGGVVTQGIHGYNGVDIGAPTGTNIFASAGGTVVVARSGGYNGGYGSYVVIQHSNGTQTLYAHMSAVLVSTGEQVGKGENIGRVGSTGRSTGPHLHFEVRGAANPFAR